VLSAGDVAELKRLRAEHAQLRMERDVLPKYRLNNRLLRNAGSGVMTLLLAR
jgi:hypothetical protein